MAVVKLEWERQVQEDLYDVTVNGDVTWVRVKKGLYKVPVGGGEIGKVGVWEDWGSVARGPEGQLVSTDGRRVLVLGKGENGNGREFNLPGQGRLWGITYLPKAETFILSDSSTHGLLFVDNREKGDKGVRLMGAWGPGDYQFKFPYYLSEADLGQDKDPEIVVSDKYNNCIKVFSVNGEFVRQLGSEGSGDQQLSRPYGVCTDAEGRVVVCDYGNERVVRFWVEEGKQKWDVVLSMRDLGGKRPKCVSMSEDGKRLVVGLEGGIVRGYKYTA